MGVFHSTFISEEDADSNDMQPAHYPDANHPVTVDEIYHCVTTADLDGLKTVNKSILLLKNRDGDTLLHKCVIFEIDYPGARLEMVQYLLSSAPDLLQKTNKQGMTALSCACAMNILNLDLVMCLLKKCTREDLVTVDYHGRTPMHHLLHRRIEIIASQEVDTWTTSQINLVLKISKLMIDKGANINLEENELKFNVLLYFINTNNTVDKSSLLKIIKFLLANGSNVYSRACGSHAINLTVVIDICKLLIDKYPESINIEDIDGHTPLYYAITDLARTRGSLHSQSQQTKHILLLLKNGAKLEQNKNIMELARRFDCNFSIIELLLKQNPTYDINTPDSEGKTLLIQYCSNVRVVEKLLSLGADRTIVANNGSCALIKSLLERHSDVYKLLGKGWKYFEPVNINSLIIFANLYCLKSTKNSDWLLRFNSALNKKEFKREEMVEVLVKVLISLMFQYNVSDKEKINHILQSIYNYNIDIYTKNNYYLRSIQIYGFDSINCDLMAYLILFPKEFIYYDMYFTEDKYEFIISMLRHGFSVSNTTDDQITSLTALLSFVEDEQNENVEDSFIYHLSRQLIENGVNIESCSLQMKNDENFIKNELRIPDSIFIAVIQHGDNVALIDLMIRNLWAPPIMMLLLCSDFNVCASMLLLSSKYQYYIPHGGIMYAVDAKIQDFKNKVRSNNKEVRQALKKYHRVMSSPLSLKDHCKFIIRSSLADAATRPDTSLPELLHELLPPLLRNFV